jgi:MFS family permease
VRRHPEDLGLHPDGAAADEQLATAPRSGMVLRDAIRRAAFWTITTSGFIGLLGSNVLFAHQVAYMIGRGLDPSFAATLAGGVGLASLPGRYLFNTLTERLPSQWVLGGSQVVLAVGVAILALASTTASFVLYGVVYGGAFGAGQALAASVRAEHFGRRAFGSISAVQGVPALGGAALGPLAAGWIYDRTGGYEIAFALVALLYLVSATAMFLTPKPPRLAVVPPAERLAVEGR